MGVFRDGIGIGGEVLVGKVRWWWDGGGFDGGFESFEGGDVGGKSEGVDGGERKLEEEEERENMEVGFRYD